jgi:TonB family protein
LSRLRPAAIVTLALLAAACTDPQGYPGAQGPYFVRPPSPHYPFTMREQGIEGRVVVAVTIERNGKPRNIRILQSSGYAAFDDEAMNALSLAVFVPPPKEVTVAVPINFVIQK